MSKEITLDIGGTPAELERITAAVEDLAEAEDWPAEFVFQITLVLEELEMNIIKHAYGDQGDAQSRIVMSSDAERLTIKIVDGGKPFNPLEEAQQPDLDASLEDRKIGGLGVHLVRSLMDEISYRREDDQNCLTLVKLRAS
ncbi:MAG: ATP-binding protein [Gammaproteobacteria bacterium]